MALPVGKMGTVIFDNSSLSPVDSEHETSLRSQTERTLQSLPPEQTPELIFQTAPESLDPRILKHCLAVCTPIDALERYQLAVTLETSYTLLREETFARSPIPAPTSKILTIDLPASSSDDEEIYNAWFSSTVSNLCTQTSNHPLPFILKFTQTISSHGVHIITTPSQQSDLCIITPPPLTAPPFGISQPLKRAPKPL